VQQRPPAQELPWQHGWPVAVPHVVGVPFEHTVFAAVFSPDATHDPEEQQPPPLHTLPTQQICAAPPHPAHTPPVHTAAPDAHDVPFATHWLFVPSQQAPPPHVPPQHG
jgi:hypothetical protein